MSSNILSNKVANMPAVSYHDSVVTLNRIKDILRDIQRVVTEPDALHALARAQSEVSLAMLRLLEVEAERAGYLEPKPQEQTI